MSVQTTNAYVAVKEAIKSARTKNQPAKENDVLHAAEVNNDLRAVDVKEAYENLRTRGEIYSYSTDGVTVVKITSEVL